jgi:lipopolysaccharide export system protein LptA
MKRLLILAPLLAASAYAPAHGQNLDLGGTPGATPTPVNITASGGITWSQDAQTVTANENAKAVRGDVTVTADQLVAHYKKAPPAPGTAASTAPASPDSLEQGGGQLTELDAIGNVHIYTATQNAWGDKAVYSMDAKVLVLTGKHLKLTTPTDTITARDSVEYYTDAHKAIARGNALVVANDGRSIAADVITGYLANAPAPPAGAAPAQAATPGDLNAGSLQKVEAVGHVVVHTVSDTATGDTGVYLPPTGQARLGGNVHVIHGPNELAGSDALVNMKTGVATLLAAPGGQVSGVILPNSSGPATGGASK